MGRSDRLSLLWKKDISVRVKSFSRYHIDACTQEIDLVEWRFSGVYGYPNASSRHNTLSLIRSLNSSALCPWLLGGDFNELLYLHEKRGGRPLPYTQIEDFRTILDDCSLQDLGFQGPRYTWCNGRASNQNTGERLDRFLGNNLLCQLFPQAWVRHGVIAHLDHLPILFDTELLVARERQQKKFRFKAMWV